jgi:F-type H+-transporting ATPase subunit c
MDNITLIGVVSIICAAVTITLGTLTPALGQTRSMESALKSIAQQPDTASTVTRTLIIGLAMIESMAIYCFVVAMIFIFANPFWNYVISKATGG